MGQTGSLRAYARHRGVTLKAVQKRRDAGAITVGADGNVDFEQADRDWSEDRRRHNGTRNKTLVEAQRRLALARVQLLRLEYRKRRGELVAVADVRRRAFEVARRARDIFLTIPDRVAPMLVPQDQLASAHALLSQEIRNAISELAAGLRGGSSAYNDGREVAP